MPGDEAPVCRAKRNQQCSRLRKVLQPITHCHDPRLHEAGNVIEAHEQVGEFKEW
jgi:hypothetical protein